MVTEPIQMVIIIVSHQFQAVFSGLIVYGKNRDDQDLEQANIRLPDDVVKLKVEKTARDYINNGRTESLEFDDKKFFVKSSDKKEVS